LPTPETRSGLNLTGVQMIKTMNLQEANDFVDDNFFNITSESYIADLEAGIINLNAETAFDIIKQISAVECATGITPIQADLLASISLMNYFSDQVDQYSREMYSAYSKISEELTVALEEKRKLINIELEV